MNHTSAVFDHVPRVLIVDDEPHNRQLLNVMLNLEGYELRFASTGEEAIQAVAQLPPDLILLDVMMPGTDGYQVATAIKENPTTKHIPIVLVTALHDHVSKMRGLSAGAEDFLTKPVDRAELLVRVRNLLRLKAYSDYHDQYSRELEGEVALRTADVRRERDRAQRYLDTATVILLALDVNGCVTLVNRFACDVLGWEEKELLGRNWIDTCISPAMRSHVRGRLGALMSGSRSVSENSITTRQGAERRIEWHSTVMLNEQGIVSGTFSSGIDVTERNSAIRALELMEERVRFALDAAHIGIWDVDFSTGNIEASTILEAQYGLAPGEFAGTNDALMQCVHPEDRESMARQMAAGDSGHDFSVQYRTLWQNGTIRWLSGTGRIHLDEKGAPLRGIGISQDITERRELERQYLQAQKLDSIGRLAAGVAHDFNNLLTVILGSTELVRSDPSLTEQNREDLLEVVRATNSAAGMTRQLLAIGRQQLLVVASLDLNQLIVEINGTLLRLCGTNITIDFSPSPTLSTLHVDRSQIEQVIMNLVVNARDAMPDGGSIRISTQEVVLAATVIRDEVVQPGCYVKLDIRDTGMGMTRETQRSIFEPFFTTKEIGKGTGLGLSTTEGIIRQSKGFVGVASTMGKGTTFSVYLPCGSESRRPPVDSSS